MKYTVDYFIKKFEKLSDDQICAFSQGEETKEKTGSHCAIGWCKNQNGFYGNANGDKEVASGNYSREANALATLFFEAGIKAKNNLVTDKCGWNVAEVNNGTHDKYQQPTPKQRILSALRDIKSQSFK